MEVVREQLAGFFSEVLPLLDERQSRLLLGSFAGLLGRGGKTAVAEAAGVSRNTVIAGAKELAGGAGPSGRVRAPGAGRKKAVDKDPDLLLELDDLVSPETRGDPMSSLRWTLESTYELARALQEKGFQISSTLVGELLRDMGYSLQGVAKVKEGTAHPDRDGQFRYLNGLVAERLAAGQPVISVDCKKKELVGEYANGGKEWQPQGQPERAKTHDFIDPEMGKAMSLSGILCKRASLDSCL